MFYLVLLLLIVLGLITLGGIGLNFGSLLGGVHLNLLIWHPSVPVLLLCLLGAFLGGLLLYVVSTVSARRDARELASLRKRIEELEQWQAKPPRGAQSTNFAPPAVPMPGFASPGPMPQQRSGPSGPLPPRPPTGSLQNLPPSASGLSQIPLPMRQGPPGPPPQSPPGAPRPPFYQQ